MASVGGVNSSNANSIYGNRNVISGLASGMDTESMIMKSVSGIQAKIASLQQKQTKVSWKQTAFQDVTDKLVQFSRKYSSYNSSTNLLSSSFFNRSVNTTASGKYADMVSATGRSSSSIEINGVSQLAESSRYQINTGGVLDTGKGYIEAGKAFDIMDKQHSSNLEGDITLSYGTASVSLKFTQEDLKSLSNTPEKPDLVDANGLVTTKGMAELINKKLDEQKITVGADTDKASKFIEAEVGADGNLSFKNVLGKTNGGNDGGHALYIQSMSGTIATTLSDTKTGKDENNATLLMKDKTLAKETPASELLADKTLTFTLDGMTKKITLPNKEDLAKLTSNADFAALLDEKLDSAFGANKINTSFTADGKLHFDIAKGSTMSLTSDAADALGMKKLETSYLNTSKTMSDLLGDDGLKELGGYHIKVAAEDIVEQKDGKSYKDKQGNLVDKDGYRLDKEGKEKAVFYDLNVNGKKIGTYTKDTALETVMLDVNSNSEAGVSLTYSKLTNQFVFTAKNSGEGYSVELEDTITPDTADTTKEYVDSTKTASLSSALFGKFEGADRDPTNKLTAGKDAQVNITVNGSNMTIKRSGNTFDVDGLSVTVKGLFNNETKADGSSGFVFADDAGLVNTANIKDQTQFSTKADADKIVGAIKDMVKDYNEMVTGLREAYNTLPAEKSNGSRYEPLTESDKEGMTESAIEAYEKNAKQGLLFGDSDLSALYSKLTSALSPSGADGGVLRSIGISTEYSKGLTTITLDETKLREMLSNNPDAVTNAFTKVKGEGSATNGLMTTLKSTLDAYAAVEGKKGVLITKAGSKYSVTNLMDNPLKTELENYDKQISTWQDKLSDKIDFYTRQYSRLEQLTAQMNSQSNSIYSMMGGQ